jgi:histidine triad (HIT) family protein
VTETSIDLETHPVTDSDCLFCKIVAGDIPADIVHRTGDILAFRDINPQAPLHVLVIPTDHMASLEAAEDGHRDVLGALMLTARDIARAEHVAEDGYRTVMNVGVDGGQTVHHVHLHLLAGRALGWPPG